MPDGFKLVILPATKVGMTRAALKHHLSEVHGPLVMSYKDVSGNFLSYVHHYVEGGDIMAEPAGADAVTVIEFADIAHLAASKSSAPYLDLVGPDEDNFREEAESRAYRAVPGIVLEGSSDTPVKLLVFHHQHSNDFVAQFLARFEETTFSFGQIVSSQLTPLGPPKAGDFFALEEFSLLDPTDAENMFRDLKKIAESFGLAPITVLITRPKVFV
jgi:EthD domain